MRRTIEIQTTGFDEYLQGVGGDPFPGGSYAGLRIPKLASPPGAANRYLCTLAGFSIAEGARARIIGYREIVTIGVQQGTGDTIRPVEMEVTSPMWRFTDGNISHHLRTMGGPNGVAVTRQGPVDAPSFKFGFSLSPAVLYQAATGTTPSYTNLATYTAPNAGQPYGSPLYNGLTAGSMYGLQTPWRTANTWTALGFDIEGPDTVVWFASVKQTDPSTRVALTVPGTFYPNGAPLEELFLLNFPTAIYWRIGVSLVIELDASSDALVVAR